MNIDAIIIVILQKMTEIVQKKSRAKLKKALKSRGLLLSDLAKKVGVNPNTVSNYFSGKTQYVGKEIAEEALRMIEDYDSQNQEPSLEERIEKVVA